jgi:7,8-dihydropterin-6-yl-methyl-4-(beta-D-ribofuranosyl)aminobenzene 5'-phosphate synthase
MSYSVISRRGYLRGSMILGGTALMAALPLRPARRLLHAQTSTPPTVDRLGVRVVIDSFQDALARSQKVGNVDVQRFGVFGAGLDKQVHNEFGLSLHLESVRGGETRNFLLDFGFTPAALMNNLAIFKVDPATLDALILSHGHFDHYGGLIGLLHEGRATMRDDLPIYVGGEDVFCQRWIKGKDDQRVSAGVLDRRDLAAEKTRVVMAEQPTVIEGQAFTTGTIARNSPEKVLPNTIVEAGVSDGVGCSTESFASHFTQAELEGRFLFDNHFGEHATCFNVKDRGLVVITSCGHAGLINTIRQAQTVSGVQKIHAVLGGFHLSPADPEYVAQIVEVLRNEIKPDYLVPMHCSGATFTQIAARDMPDKLIMSYTGSRYVFGT